MAVVGFPKFSNKIGYSMLMEFENHELNVDICFEAIIFYFFTDKCFVIEFNIYNLLLNNYKQLI